MGKVSNPNFAFDDCLGNNSITNTWTASVFGRPVDGFSYQATVIFSAF